MRQAWIRLATISSLLLAHPAVADWPAGGKRVATLLDGAQGSGPVRMLDVQDGSIAVWSTSLGSLSNGYVLQRIDRFGVVLAGWPAEGVGFGGLSKTIRGVGFAIDDFENGWQAVVVNGSPANLTGRFVGTSGAMVPAGAPWSFAPEIGPTPTSLAPAPGGVYAYFDNRLQRCLRGGVVAPGWPANGLATIGGYLFSGASLPDGAGGVILLSPWWNSSSLATRMPAIARIDSSAVVHAGWPAAGIPLSNDPGERADLGDGALPALIRSDDTHLIAAWSTAPADNQSLKRVRLQRFSIDGVIDPAWPANGVQAVAPDTISSMTALPDHSGGVYVLWHRQGIAKGTHVQADGLFVPGTNDAGTVLPATNVPYEPPTTFGSNILPYVPADVTPDGGLVYAWGSGPLEPAIHVRWLLPDLTNNPAEPDGGRLIVPSQGQLLRAVHSDEVGGAYVAWEAIEQFPPPNDYYYAEIWMTRLLPSSLVGVPPRSPRAAALALSAPRPNPARDAVALDLTLPDDSPARVELLDVAGRVQRAEVFAGAGRHVVAFERLGSLAPGLYFARATSADGARVARVVVGR